MLNIIADKINIRVLVKKFVTIKIAISIIDLKLSLAGIALQKFMNYHIKVSVTIENKNKIQGRFKELLNELNKSNDFRVFNNIRDAENWIINAD
ncbi:DUF4180 domain-containing protein [Clostridium sp. CCUG 7971]|uniref:DUF4180 domain-containing protein n=1 Tax=Clostridium sp. CCUG 7971 TaxID=2811414 RepID=UPI001ABB7C74|nr:DUF4180 domain-containing protein [Clostridium sp. CCUG 7971]MBO3443887.1 DUF4180 domain-containing protein [Clostridium sp. CCUG 7971]